MEKVGLIGYGSWGKLLYKKLDTFCDVEFTCRSKDTYFDKLDSVNWVVIATPNDTHYEIVKNCLNAGKNVFCEKPLTPTYEQSLELFKLAKENGVRLYVDDVQNYREVKWDLMENNLIERKKKDSFNHSYYTNKDLLYRLAYHDIYYLYPHIKNSEIESIVPIDIKNKIHYRVKFNDITIEFVYDTNYEYERVHHINGTSLMGDGTDDPLGNMLERVILYPKLVEFVYNENITLFTNRFIDTLNKNLFSD